MNGLKDAEIDLSGLGALGATDDMMDFADARASLSKAIQKSIVQFDSEAVAEFAAIREACGVEYANELLEYVVRLKYYQNTSALGRLIEALKALSLYEYMQKQVQGMFMQGGK